MKFKVPEFTKEFEIESLNPMQDKAIPLYNEMLLTKGNNFLTSFHNSKQNPKFFNYQQKFMSNFLKK